MAKEKNYSKRLQEIEQSNPATLPKRFVDLERQRDKYKKEAEQYREERDTATNKFYEAKAEIEKLKLRLHYHGQNHYNLRLHTLKNLVMAACVGTAMSATLKLMMSVILSKSKKLYIVFPMN